MVRFTLAFLVALVLGTLAFAPDEAQAFGHGRRAAGCGAAASGCAGAHAGYSGWYPGKHLLGFERRQARRSRRAARHATYASSCAGPAAASCSEPSGYSVAPPATYEGTPAPVTAGCPCGCPDCTCNRADPAVAPACPIDPVTGKPVCPNPLVQ